MDTLNQAYKKGDISSVANQLVNDFFPETTLLICNMCGHKTPVLDQWIKTADLADLGQVTCSDKCKAELNVINKENNEKNIANYVLYLFKKTNKVTKIN